MSGVQLRVEEAWVGDQHSVPVPDAVLTAEGAFFADGRTPYEISDDEMRAAGWRKQWRLVSDWMDG